MNGEAPMEDDEEEVPYDVFNAYNTNNACFQMPSQTESFNSANNVPPPPSYEEALTSGSPKLNCADFFPQALEPGNKLKQQCPLFPPFCTIMHTVNQWLASVPSIRLIRCECIERLSDFDGNLEMGRNLQLEPGQRLRIYVSGIRLWYYLLPDNNKPNVQLWYFNAIPKVSIEIEKESYMMKRRNRRYAMVAQQRIRNVIVESLSAFNSRLNQQLTACAIPGKILNVCVTPFRMDFNSNAEANLDISFQWHMHNRNRLIGYLHRIFYAIGPPVRQLVQVACFAPIPKGMSPGLSGHVLYESFDETMARALKYCADYSRGDIQVTDVQTTYHSTAHNGKFYSLEFDRDVWPSSGAPSGNTKDTSSLRGPGGLSIAGFAKDLMYLNTEQTMEMYFGGGYFNRRTYRCVRVATLSPKGEPNSLPLCTTGQLTSQLYVPYQIGGTSFETVEQLVNRIFSNLATQNDVRILFAESTTHAISLHTKYPKYDIPCVEENESHGGYRLYGIRVVFDGAAHSIPDPQIASNGATKSKGCLIL